MDSQRGIWLCLGYLIGIGLTGFWGAFNPQPNPMQWGLMVGLILLVAIAASAILPRYFWQWPRRLWFMVALVMLLAVFYTQLRLPRPPDQGLYQLAQSKPSLLRAPVTIVGSVLDLGSAQADQKQRLWLGVEQLTWGAQSTPQRGKLYLTLGEESQPLARGDRVSLKGRLYQPKPPGDRQQFNFAQYLRRHGAFLGFTAWEAQRLEQNPALQDKLRNRIIRSQGRFLPENMASLLSAMVLGRQAVALDPALYDLWVKAGLAYTVAASGFHVALLLGVVSWLLRHQSPERAFYGSLAILLAYVMLTGLQPSVLRAALMGSAGLLALRLERQVKPIALLLLTATFLLFLNPFWFWDVGFQLSFLATFGLLSTLDPLQERLEFVPPTVATAIAIPIAATLWTLPLLAYHFNVFATYSILTSIILSPIIAVVSLGGMASGVVGLISPILGGAIAYGTGFLLQPMAWLVSQVVTWPGAQLAIASLHWSQLLVFYGVMLLIWGMHPIRRWTKPLALGLVTCWMLLLLYRQFAITEVVIFGDRQAPSVIIRSQGKSVVISDLATKTEQYLLLPYLRRAGINHVNAIIPLGEEQLEVQPQAIAGDVISLQSLTPLNLGPISLQLLAGDPAWVSIRVKQQLFYLLLSPSKPEGTVPTQKSGMLITAAEDLDFATWQRLQPQGAIAIGNPEGHFLAPSSIVFWSEEDGTIRWTPQAGLMSLAPNRF